MDDHTDAGILRADLVDMLGQEALVDRAVPFPEDNARAAQLFRRCPAVNHEWVPDHALIERNAHGKGSVAAQMLIGKEEDLFVALKGPFEAGRRIRRSAHQATAFAT